MTRAMTGDAVIRGMIRNFLTADILTADILTVDAATGGPS
jgi:hypothetical protein